MPRTKCYTSEQLEQTRQLLRDAAARGPRTPDRYTRQELFQELHAEFDELRRQGFTNVQIAEIASQGLADVLGAPTLQKFLAPTKRKKRKKRGDGNNGATPATPPKPKPTPVPAAQKSALPPSTAKPHDARNQDPMSLRERS